MKRNTDFIYEAIEAVQESTGISMSLKLSETELDGFLQVQQTTFQIYAVTAVRNSTLGQVIHQIEQIRESTSSPVIVISNYISLEAIREFKNRSILYIDSAGNASIRHNELFIFIEGKKTKHKEKTNVSRAFQEAGIKILLTLLVNPESLHLSYRELAEKAGVSLGSLSNVLNELEALHFLLRSKNLKVLKNKTELLNRWVAAYNEVLRPRIFRKKMRFIHPDDKKVWSKLAEDKETKGFQWGGEPGASLNGENLRPEIFTLYSNHTLPELATTLRMYPDPDGEIEVLFKFWDTSLDQGNKAPQLIIYADLIQSGSGRNFEIAQQLLKHEVLTHK